MIGIPFFDEWDYLDHHEAQLFAGQNLPLNKRYVLKSGELHEVYIYLEHCGYCFAYADDDGDDYARGYYDESLETTRGDGCDICSHTGVIAYYGCLPFFDDPDFPF